MSVRLLALTMALALGVAGAAAARPEPTKGSGPEVEPVGTAQFASAATFVIKGHGWGHGIGMSQYGALGYAQRGFTYDRILAHYFPGTQLGPSPVAKVRVLLASGLRIVTVSSEQPFQVKDALGGKHKLSAGAHAFGPGLRLKFDELDPKLHQLPGPLVFIAGAAPLEFGHAYRGQLQVTSNSTAVQVVNLVGLEGYLNGVVPSEMPYYWPAEALKAQAVVARSYALATRKTGAFDLYSDTRSQVYRGIEAERPSTNAAVAATAGQVVLYGDQVAHTYFFSTSGGRTAAVTDVWPNAQPLPYLVSVPDPYDSVSPYHDWGPFAFTPKTLGRRLHVPGKLLDLRTIAGVSGRVRTVTAIGTLGAKMFAGSDVRRTLGLRSTWFGVGVLSLAAPAAPVLYGGAVTLKGVARGLTGVMLEQRAGSSGWQSQSTVSSAKDGSFSVLAKPRQTGFYRLSSGTTVSGTIRVPVAPVVRLYPVTVQTELRGLVRPVMPGAKIEIQRLQTGWVKASSTLVDASGNFDAQLSLVPGEYRARVLPSRGFVSGFSSVLEVLVG